MLAAEQRLYERLRFIARSGAEAAERQIEAMLECMTDEEFDVMAKHFVVIPFRQTELMPFLAKLMEIKEQ